MYLKELFFINYFIKMSNNTLKIQIGGVLKMFEFFIGIVLGTLFSENLKIFIKKISTSNDEKSN
ncbi:hypothetical protein OSSY52_18740 [Tepiditoga spiralis]|uniref:Uncharacterized protein n=1 Tax=Tepiditoga spiralis TaxID=2108365 RepID=A0A7G1G9R1_9BACT|nr:hypothetical protein OSSY52_18740 [Tepiditoga spiralis]